MIPHENTTLTSASSTGSTLLYCPKRRASKAFNRFYTYYLPFTSSGTHVLAEQAETGKPEPDRDHTSISIQIDRASERPSTGKEGSDIQADIDVTWPWEGINIGYAKTRLNKGMKSKRNELYNGILLLNIQKTLNLLAKEVIVLFRADLIKNNNTSIEKLLI